MNTNSNTTGTREAAIGGLAVVGFIALVVAGMWLAAYSTRYVPSVVNRLGAAAVYLGSVFTPAPKPGLSVVPTASTTIPFGEASSTVTTSTPTPVKTPVKTPVQTGTTAGTKTNQTQQIAGTNVGATVLSGSPDLVVVIKAVGYLATSSADSFVATSTVSSGSRPAVSFTIKNVGTNTTGSWRFSASIPTQTAYIYQSQPQQSLNPGDSIDYVLGFDQSNRGNQTISISANFDHAVTESNPNNNSASANIIVLGS